VGAGLTDNIVDRIDSDDIDLQSDLQRQEVWSIKKRKRLVDTVLRGWSIPPIHLVVIEESRMEVLDGQQRLATIRDFLHNVFSIDGHITPVDPRISLCRQPIERLRSVSLTTRNGKTMKCVRDVG